MATANRIEGIGGGSGRGVGSSSVRVVPPSKLKNLKNQVSKINAKKRKSGEAAKQAAERVEVGVPKATIKIKSGGDIKPALPKKVKPKSYNQLKNMPNLIKIDSAKGNKVIKRAYRKSTSN